MANTTPWTAKRSRKWCCGRRGVSPLDGRAPGNGVDGQRVVVTRHLEPYRGRRKMRPERSDWRDAEAGLRARCYERRRLHRNPADVHTRQQRIATNALAPPQRSFPSLVHQWKPGTWLEEACRRVRKEGAVGMDGQSAVAFEAERDGHLEWLREAVQSGRYRVPLVPSACIPKGDGCSQRPIGIPTLAKSSGSGR